MDETMTKPAFTLATSYNKRVPTIRHAAAARNECPPQHTSRSPLVCRSRRKKKVFKQRSAPQQSVLAVRNIRSGFGIKASGLKRPPNHVVVPGRLRVLDRLRVPRATALAALCTKDALVPPSKAAARQVDSSYGHPLDLAYWMAPRCSATAAPMAQADSSSGQWSRATHAKASGCATHGVCSM